MRYILLWMAILEVVLGVAVWADAQQSGPMQGRGGMTGQGMMGGQMHGAQATGNAASNYTNLCSTCHGVTGKGDGPAAAALHPKPTDFADCKRMAIISDETVFKAIKGGGQSVGLSPLMPPSGGSLTDQRIKDLVSYVRDFCKNK